MLQRDRVGIVLGELVLAALLDRLHLHDDRRDRDLHGGDRDLVGRLQVLQRLEMRRLGVEVHRDRRHRGDALHAHVGARAVPDRDERGRPGRSEMRGARQQHVVDDRRSAELDVFGGELQPHLLGLGLDQLLLLHHDQGQEADAARALRDLHHVDFGLRERGNEQQRRNENALHGHAFLPTSTPASFSSGFTNSVMSASGPCAAFPIAITWRTALPTIIGTPSASASSRQSLMSL